MFTFKRNQFQVEDVLVRDIVEKVGTPVYIYSKNRILDNFKLFDQAFNSLPHLICYALKANSNLSVARTLAVAGAGTDIVSGGELYRALASGFRAKKIVFSGVGKTKDEMRYALRAGILMFNVESSEELNVLNEVAGVMKKKARVAIRVNPNVEADTHHHITTGKQENKFGIHKNTLLDVYKNAKKLHNIELHGLQAHIGSQITSVKPYVELLTILLDFIDKLAKQGIVLKTLDIGGGLGITYDKEVPPTPQDLALALTPLLRERPLTLLFEPGRFMVGNSGILVTQVLYRKEAGEKTFVIVDAAMNDLARPALYDAYHEITPLVQDRRAQRVVDVVGPICESGDYFARQRKIPFPKCGEYLAILSAGAYGFAMSSQYNSRPRVAEVMADGKYWKIIRKRESLKDLIRGEK